MPHCKCTQTDQTCKCNGCAEAFDCDLCPEHGCQKNPVNGARTSMFLCFYTLKPGYREAWKKLNKGAES